MKREKDEREQNNTTAPADDNGSTVADTTEPVDNDNTTVAKQNSVKKQANDGKRWVPYVITAAALAVMVVLIGWVQGGFSDAKAQTLVGYWSDAFFVPGILCVCFGLLLLASNGGAFDMLAYAFKSLFRLFKKDVVDRKYGGYYEYSQARKAKKRSFAYMLIVGGAYTLVGIALLVVYSVCFD